MGNEGTLHLKGRKEGLTDGQTASQAVTYSFPIWHGSQSTPGRKSQSEDKLDGGGGGVVIYRVKERYVAVADATG